MKNRDRYGFFFWLRWILWFAGSFVLASAAWTTLIRTVFGRIEGVELTITWSVGVFGSWFLLVIPFMRKKEQIWKRLNSDQEAAVDAWFRGMGLFLSLLILSSFFWSLWLRERLTPGEGVYTGWVKAVFGTWLVLAIPFLILMYRQADKIFKSAVARQTYEPGYRKAYVDVSKRTLPEALTRKLGLLPPTLKGGHVVTLFLKDGQRVPHVFVVNSREIVGIYDRQALDFGMEELNNLEQIHSDQLPAYEESKWLRLDAGVGS